MQLWLRHYSYFAISVSALHNPIILRNVQFSKYNHSIEMDCICMWAGRRRCRRQIGAGGAAGDLAASAFNATNAFSHSPLAGGSESVIWQHSTERFPLNGTRKVIKCSL